MALWVNKKVHGNVNYVCSHSSPPGLALLVPFYQLDKIKFPPPFLPCRSTSNALVMGSSERRDIWTTTTMSALWRPALNFTALSEYIFCLHISWLIMIVVCTVHISSSNSPQKPFPSTNPNMNIPSNPFCGELAVLFHDSIKMAHANTASKKVFVYDRQT